MPFLSHFGINLETAGYAIVFIAAAAESGLLVGMFFPGDSLMIASGIVASQGYLDVRYLLVAAFAGAIIGDTVAYFLGSYFGPKIFKRENSFFFNKEYVDVSKAFYDRHGGKTVLLARFIPAVRTFAPIFAGIGHMRYRTFLFFNLVGGFLWSFGLILLGYFIGNRIRGLSHYTVLAALLVAGIVAVPVAARLLRNPARRARIKRFLGGDSNG